VYRGQKLVGDIVDFLADFGFVLRQIQEHPNFDGDSVEFDAFFTKRRQEVLSLPEVARKKFLVLIEVWELAAYFFSGDLWASNRITCPESRRRII